MDKSIYVFFVLVKAGLWEQEVQLMPLGEIDFSRILSLSEEQSVVGLVAAGIEQVSDTKVAKSDVLPFIGQSFQMEQRNIAMNCFIGEIVEKMREEGIYSLLVKGQGIAQCYAKPLWRSCGDVDLLLDEDNYKKAYGFLSPMAQSIDEENPVNLHQGMRIGPWAVELHGSLRSGLGRQIDKEIDSIQDKSFQEGRSRVWKNGDTEVFLPAPDDDIIFVFSHILQHFFKGGIGLRQICDWCRLLWTYRDMVDKNLLERRLKNMRLNSEWKAFAALAVEWLGMPVGAMPFYSEESKWRRKASRILAFIFETGNFGHNRDNSRYWKYSFIVYKTISFFRNTWDSIRHFLIFPKDAVRVWWLRFKVGVVAMMKGK